MQITQSVLQDVRGNVTMRRFGDESKAFRAQYLDLPFDLLDGLFNELLSSTKLDQGTTATVLAIAGRLRLCVAERPSSNPDPRPTLFLRQIVERSLAQLAYP